MPTFRITAPNGKTYNVTGPDGSTAEQALAQVQAQHVEAPQHVNSPAMTAAIDNDAISQDAKSGPSLLGELAGQTGNLIAGGIRGAGSIGATLLYPIDKANDLIQGDRGPNLTGLVTGQQPISRNQERRQEMDAGLRTMGADTSAPAFAVGKIGGEIAGTAGAGGLVANAVARVAPGVAAAAPNLLQAIRTGGMSANAARAPLAAAASNGNMLTRVVGGAINGGASAALVDPKDAVSGGVIGAALPVVSKAAGVAGSAAANALRGGGVSPEVTALADRAKELGIQIPADRLVNSKPLNALAASLNYVPMSGRAGTESAMYDQMNTALSRTFGQNSPNVTQALRKASGDLGAQFDSVLKSNTVKMTPQFQQQLAEAADQATKELGPEQASIIHRQIADIQTKAALTGELDGQTAYNIKKTLDRIGDRNSPEAFYARDLKRSLMGALNDSMTPEAAGSFSTLRKQYGNMLDLQNLASNGAEGGVSIGRLANLKNIGNPDVQELADIAAQFMRTRENPHGALQRIVIGGTAAAGAHGMGALGVLPAAMAAGRGANAALNSNAARNYVLGNGAPNALNRLLSNDEAAQLAYRVAPNALADQ